MVVEAPLELNFPEGGWQCPSNRTLLEASSEKPLALWGIFLFPWCGRPPVYTPEPLPGKNNIRLQPIKFPVVGARGKTVFPRIPHPCPSPGFSPQGCPPCCFLLRLPPLLSPPSPPPKQLEGIFGTAFQPLKSEGAGGGVDPPFGSKGPG